jgi:hypothetical protein
VLNNQSKKIELVILIISLEKEKEGQSLPNPHGEIYCTETLIFSILFWFPLSTASTKKDIANIIKITI